jgi:nitric oxide dioxygenase
MTPRDIRLVRASFDAVKHLGPVAAALFYGRLFETSPELQPLFKGDLVEQGHKLMATLSIVVNGLNDIESVLPAAEALARRHVGYGVQPEHYAPVGEALVWTLQKVLGSSWTADLANAWEKAYGLVSASMIEAAYPSRRQALQLELA